MDKSSTWMALQNPAFRKLWIATVISGTCVLMSLLLASRLSINVSGDLEESVSGVPSIRAESKEVTPIALTNELLAAPMLRRKIMNNKQQENGARTGPLIFTVPAYGFVMALYLDWLNGPMISRPCPGSPLQWVQ